MPGDARNLAWRAAEAFLARARTPNGVAIRLAKRIPSGAGLGGGSSDAGAVLRGLAALLPGAVPEAALRELALGLGADVPFFLDPRPAEVGGIGERILPAVGVPPLPLVVVHPGVALGTKDVYAGFADDAAARGSAGPDREPLGPPSRLADQGAEAWRARVRNDLEPPAVRLCPRIASSRRARGSGRARRGDVRQRSRGLRRLRGRSPSATRRRPASRSRPGERAFATETMPSV